MQNTHNIKAIPGRLCPLYSSSTDTKAQSCFFIPASVMVSILNNRRSLQNQTLSILSWNAPSEIPGGRMKTISWRFVCFRLLGTKGHEETRICPGCCVCPMTRVEYKTMCPHELFDWCKRRVSRPGRVLFCFANIRNIHNMQNMYNRHSQCIFCIFWELKHLIRFENAMYVDSTPVQR